MRRCKAIITGLLLILFSMVTAVWAGPEDDAQEIAQVMRELQARNNYLHQIGYPKSEYLYWPNITCGNLRTPPFPPDAWYVHEFRDDPEKAADAVDRIV